MKKSILYHLSCQHTVPSYTKEQSSVSLWLHARGAIINKILLPRRVFCCLVVEILQKSPTGWHPHFSKGDTYHTFSICQMLSLCLRLTVYISFGSTDQAP